MIGSFLTRGLVMVFGYAYPAYECFKSVEKNKPDIEELRFWCQYWILVAGLTVCERIGDTFVSWLPMYSEAKLAFYIYLWFPKTKGTTYVYDSFFRPYISKHEPDIDRNIMELRTRAGDMFVLYWQRAASYGQTRIFDILQYVASQSTPKPRPPQMKMSDSRKQGILREVVFFSVDAQLSLYISRFSQMKIFGELKIYCRLGSGLKGEPPGRARAPAPNRRAPAADAEQRLQVQPTQSTLANVIKAQKALLSESLAVISKPQTSQTSNDVEMTETEPSGSENSSNPTVKEIMMEEAVKVYTRARSRKSSATTLAQ
ncbi:TB2/DP1/HVA22-related protein [Artemisia annua]|uniref:HVA22-like protein n=1 Tax=Artemisia annua TaxID=35608 RepID=A0A2U1MCD3_ARTAN|nr:TB2/DP1/HVA22-related protein [Artemisia annua]